MVLLHPLEDADVGDAERASAFESHADDRTAGGGDSGQGGGGDALLAKCGDGE
jgi:hypothetical protein